MKTDKLTVTGMIGQWTSLFMTTTGFIIMVITGAAVWHDFITAGALTLTIATKMRYYREVYAPNKRRRKLVSITSLVERDRQPHKSASKQ